MVVNCVVCVVICCFSNWLFCVKICCCFCVKYRNVLKVIQIVVVINVCSDVNCFVGVVEIKVCFVILIIGCGKFIQSVWFGKQCVFGSVQIVLVLVVCMCVGVKIFFVGFVENFLNRIFDWFVIKICVVLFVNKIICGVECQLDFLMVFIFICIIMVLVGFFFICIGVMNEKIC